MRTLANTLVLVLALLLSQSAAALHEFDCLDETHVQTCQVCSAYDHSACDTLSQNQFESIGFEENPQAVSGSFSRDRCYSRYLSRAPPLKA